MFGIRALLVGCLSLALLSSAQAQKEPILEVRAKSIEGLLGYAEYVGDLANQGEIARQLAEFIKSAAEGKTGLEGVNIRQPIGLYAYMTADVADSPIVLMIPIADQEAFLNLLRGKASLDPRKEKDNQYSLEVPNIPDSLTLHFQNGYAYLVGSYAKRNNAVTLIEPKKFFPKGEAAAILEAKLFVERIPDSVRKAIIANAELKFADAKERDEPGDTPASKKLRQWLLGEGFSIAAQLLQEARYLGLSFDIDPKADQLKLDVELTPKSGTALQKQFEQVQSRTGLGGAWLQGGSPTALSVINVALGTSQKKGLAAVVEMGFRELAQSAKGPEKKVVQRLLNAIQPTIAAGELDFFTVVPSEVKPGQIPVVGGLRVIEGKKIEDAIKAMEILIPDEVAKLSFDVKKLGDYTIHKVEISEADIAKQLGSKTVWLAISDTAILYAIHANDSLLSQAVKKASAAAVKTPILRAEVAGASVVRLLEQSLSAEKINELADASVGTKAGEIRDRIALNLSSDNGLKLNFRLNGQFIKFAMLIDQERKK